MNKQFQAKTPKSNKINISETANPIKSKFEGHAVIHGGRQTDRAAGWVSYGQKWKTVNGRQYFMDIIHVALSSTTMM